MNIIDSDEFQQVDAMVSAYDAEGDGPLRKGETVFNWGLVKKMCIPLYKHFSDLRVAIWLLRASLSEQNIQEVYQSLQRIADWTKTNKINHLSTTETLKESFEEDANVNILVLDWLASHSFLYYFNKLKINEKNNYLLSSLNEQNNQEISFEDKDKIEASEQLKGILNEILIIEEYLKNCNELEGGNLKNLINTIEKYIYLLKPRNDYAINNLLTKETSKDETIVQFNNREEVKKTIIYIIEYFEKNEPSHPGPIFLKRVNKMLGANFEEIMHELFIDSQQLISKIEKPIT